MMMMIMMMMMMMNTLKVLRTLCQGIKDTVKVLRHYQGTEGTVKVLRTLSRYLGHCQSIKNTTTVTILNSEDSDSGS